MTNLLIRYANLYSAGGDDYSGAFPYTQFLGVHKKRQSGPWGRSAGPIGSPFKRVRSTVERYPDQ